MVSGTKRPSPECPVSPSHCQSPSTSSINGHLVYVRRKPEAELGKNCAFDCIRTNNCQHPRHAGQVEGISQQNPEIKEPKDSRLPAFSPAPLTSSTSSSAKKLLCLYLLLHWEERYYQLQMLLKKLDQSDLEDYAWTKLSKHAVELEKRSIQLSLEEEIRENTDGVSEMEVIVDCLQAVNEFDYVSVYNQKILTSGTYDEELEEISCLKIIQESKTMESKVSDLKATVGIENGGELEDKTMVNSQSVNNETTGLSYLGSIKKEKEWKRTLACKLFEGRHKVTTSNGGGKKGGNDIKDDEESEVSGTRRLERKKQDKESLGMAGEAMASQDLESHFAKDLQLISS
ncbi:Ubiquitin family protein isoform 1 [Hibiscus syriacus]|uniref:Ubiquitin family protein isoform 1 n=1 Tax=Hibiscus syriacus TaxID=106335 RepID=A0A6A3APR4_HIBSY|nr:Ubiquitin family protein isoform 1 [Hibiscus syriacus]